MFHCSRKLIRILSFIFIRLNSIVSLTVSMITDKENKRLCYMLIVTKLIVLELITNISCQIRFWASSQYSILFSMLDDIFLIPRFLLIHTLLWMSIWNALRTHVTIVFKSEHFLKHHYVPCTFYVSIIHSIVQVRNLTSIFIKLSYPL